MRKPEGNKAGLPAREKGSKVKGKTIKREMQETIREASHNEEDGAYASEA